MVIEPGNPGGAQERRASDAVGPASVDPRRPVQPDPALPGEGPRAALPECGRVAGCAGALVGPWIVDWLTS